jgi:Uma2 family endonuclease
MPEPVPTPIQPHRWTRQQYEKMVQGGVLTEEDRVELLNGRIVAMSPQNSQHATAVTLCRRALEAACGDEVFVRTQAPLALGPHSEPEPDLALISGTARDFWDEHPSQAVLVVEVADTSLEKDREHKRRLYAEHGVPEYWILNLEDLHVEVYQSPTGNDYEEKTTYHSGDDLPLASAPCSPISVTDLIP